MKILRLSGSRSVIQLYGSRTLQRKALELCNPPHFNNYHFSFKTQPYPFRIIDMKKNEKVPPIHPTAPYVFQILYYRYFLEMNLAEYEISPK